MAAGRGNTSLTRHEQKNVVLPQRRSLGLSQELGRAVMQRVGGGVNGSKNNERNTAPTALQVAFGPVQLGESEGSDLLGGIYKKQIFISSCSHRHLSKFCSFARCRTDLVHCLPHQRPQNKVSALAPDPSQHPTTLLVGRPRDLGCTPAHQLASFLTVRIGADFAQLFAAPDLLPTLTLPSPPPPPHSRNGERTAGLGGLGLAGIVNDRLVVLVCAVGEVHAHDIETSLAEGIDLLGGVGLGPNGADNGGATVLTGRRVLSVELRQPFDPRAAGVQVVERVRHCGSEGVEEGKGV